MSFPATQLGPSRKHLMFYPHAVYFMPLIVHSALCMGYHHSSFSCLANSYASFRTHSGTSSSRKPPLTFPVSFLYPENSNLTATYIFSQHFVLDICFLPNRLGATIGQSLGLKISILSAHNRQCFFPKQLCLNSCVFWFEGQVGWPSPS